MSHRVEIWRVISSDGNLRFPLARRSRVPLHVSQTFIYSQNNTLREGDVEPIRDDAGCRCREQTSKRSPRFPGSIPAPRREFAAEFHSRRKNRIQSGLPLNVKMAKRGVDDEECLERRRDEWLILKAQQTRKSRDSREKWGKTSEGCNIYLT